MTKLSTVSVGAGGSASISFSNIPQGYTDLVLKLSTRTTASGWTTTGLTLTFNGSSASVYSRRSLYNTSAGSAGSNSTSSTTSFVGGIVSCGASSTSNTFGTASIYIPNYSDFNYKNISVESVSENNGTDTAQTYTFGLFADPSPITSLTLTDANGGSFVQHSIATLYGVKDTIKTAGNSIKATGGNIAFDGTYVYHVFSTTGTFTPTQSLIADYLVVAGGGGGGGSIGGGYLGGGGGGAGGYRTSIGESALSLSATAYTVTVGGGGAGGTANRGSQGNNSVFDSITSTGGGYGGAQDATPIGGNGGSGGGGSTYIGTVAGGTGVSGQGFAGGTSTAQAGGGGGAGAAGTNGVNSPPTYGVGGVGSTSYSTWGLATGFGQNVSGTVYFAGGGGGGKYFDAGAGPAGGLGGGGTGGAKETSSTGTGTANTGGGGGGAGGSAGSNLSGAAGGSGIVIIRYKG
jgi:hypothetical protein